MNPQRWQDQTSGPGAEAGKLAAEVGEAQTLSSAAQARILARLEAVPSGGFFTPRLIWVGVLVGSAALAGAVMTARRAPSEPVASPQPRKLEAPVVARPWVVETPPLEEEKPVVEELVERVPRPTKRPKPVKAQEPEQPSEPSTPEVTPSPAPSAPAPNPLLEESRLLGKAVSQLRREGAPREALMTLDDYFQRYPSGALVADAEVVRIDALLALDRSAEALVHLEALAQRGMGGLARAGELGVLRGELLLKSNQPARAQDAFSAALATPLPDALVERALYGRAVALRSAGEVERSRTELEQYLTRFPRGRFATAAKEAL